MKNYVDTGNNVAFGKDLLIEMGADLTAKLFSINDTFYLPIKTAKDGSITCLALKEQTDKQEGRTI